LQPLETEMLEAGLVLALMGWLDTVEMTFDDPLVVL
jgi:hypothetical protein